MFTDGLADYNLKGAGKSRATRFSKKEDANVLQVRPMNYISATRTKMRAQLRNIINKLKR